MADEIDNTSIMYSVYLRKYGVSQHQLDAAIRNGEIQSRKLGSNIFWVSGIVGGNILSIKMYSFL